MPQSASQLQWPMMLATCLQLAVTVCQPAAGLSVWQLPSSSVMCMYYPVHGQTHSTGGGLPRAADTSEGSSQGVHIDSGGDVRGRKKNELPGHLPSSL